MWLQPDFSCILQILREASVRRAIMGKRSRAGGDEAGDAGSGVAQALERAAQRAARVAALDAAGEPQLEEDHPLKDEDIPTKRPLDFSLLGHVLLCFSYVVLLSNYDYTV